jgi:hypothetical protein
MPEPLAVSQKAPNVVRIVLSPSISPSPGSGHVASERNSEIEKMENVSRRYEIAKSNAKQSFGSQKAPNVVRIVLSPSISPSPGSGHAVNAIHNQGQNFVFAKSKYEEFEIEM